MQSILEEVLRYLSKQLLISLVIFIAAISIFIKFYEIFLAKRISKRFKFFRDREKEVPFELFLASFLFLATCLVLIKFSYAIPFIWLLNSSGLLLGGLLGLIPFSFIEKTKTRKKHRKT